MVTLIRCTALVGFVKLNQMPKKAHIYTFAELSFFACAHFRALLRHPYTDALIQGVYQYQKSIIHAKLKYGCVDYYYENFSAVDKCEVLVTMIQCTRIS